MTNDEANAPESDEERARLPDEAAVTRGGLSTAETLEATAVAHNDLYDVYAISVRAAMGMTADELALAPPPLPQPKIREATVGAIRKAGYDVVPDEPPPNHALIMLPALPADDDYLRITSILGPARPNPAFRKEQQ
jgi:hypothetical protein